MNIGALSTLQTSLWSPRRVNTEVTDNSLFHFTVFSVTFNEVIVEMLPMLFGSYKSHRLKSFPEYLWAQPHS